MTARPQRRRIGEHEVPLPPAKRINGEVGPRRHPLEPNQRELGHHGLTQRLIVAVVRVLAPPLVAEESVWAFFVVVGAMVRIPGVDGTKAQCCRELPGLPDSLLSGHEANRGSIERKGGQVLLPDEWLTVGSKSIEEGEGGGSDQPIDFGVREGHRVESIQILP
jgi:hypothetical protein